MEPLDKILDPTGDKFNVAAGERVQRFVPAAIPDRVKAIIPEKVTGAEVPQELPTSVAPQSGAGHASTDATDRSLEQRNVTGMEVLEGAVPSSSVLFQIGKNVERSMNRPVGTAGYRVPDEFLRDRTSDEQDELRTAASEAEVHAMIGDQTTRREYERQAGGRGPWMALAASAVVAIPDEFIAAKVVPGASVLSSVARRSAAFRRGAHLAAAARAARTGEALDIASAAVARADSAAAMTRLRQAQERVQGWQGVVVENALSTSATTGAMIGLDHHYVGAEDILQDFVFGSAIGFGIKGAAAIDRATGITTYASRLLGRRDQSFEATQDRVAEVVAEDPTASPEAVQEQVLQEGADRIRRDALAIEEADTGTMLEQEDLDPEPPEAEEPEPAPAPEPKPKAKREKKAKAEPKDEPAVDAEEPEPEEWSGEIDLSDDFESDQLSDIEARDMGIPRMAARSDAAAQARRGANLGHSDEVAYAIRNNGRRLLLEDQLQAGGLFNTPLPFSYNGFVGTVKGFTKGGGDWGTVEIEITEARGKPVKPTTRQHPLDNFSADAFNGTDTSSNILRWLATFRQNGMIGAEHAYRTDPGRVLTQLGLEDDAKAMSAIAKESFGAELKTTMTEVNNARAAGQRILIERDGQEHTIPEDAEALLVRLTEDFRGGDTVIILRASKGTDTNPNATQILNKRGDAVVVVDFTSPDWANTLIHEFGHEALSAGLRDSRVPAKVKADLAGWHADLIKKYLSSKGLQGAIDAMAQRGPLTGMYANHLRAAVNAATGHGSMLNMLDYLQSTSSNTGLPQVGAAAKINEAWAQEYLPSFTESLAEQFTRYVNRAIYTGEGSWDGMGVPVSVAQYIVTQLEAAFRFFKRGVDEGVFSMDARFEDFMDNLLAIAQRDRQTSAVYAAGVASRAEAVDEDARAAAALLAGSVAAARVQRQWAPAGPVRTPTQVRQVYGVKLQEFQSKDPLSARVGIDSIPTGDPQERGTYKAIRTLWYNALNWAAQNPYDSSRHSRLLGKVRGALSAQSILAQSNNAVARYISNILLESPTGADMRRPTAAIRTALNLKKIMGNVVREYEDLALKHAKGQGKGYWEALVKGDHRQQFDRAVFQEIEDRSAGRASQAAPEVQAAADAVEGAYQRSADMQRYSNTIGAKLLPNSSRGYHPHKLSPAKVMALTPKQTRELADVFADQIIQSTGWSPEFGQQLAYRIVEHARVKATGGLEIDANVHSHTNADIVADALRAMGLSQQEVQAHMARFQRGAASHVRQRLALDMSAPFTRADGSRGTLADVYTTDVLSVLRNQSRRVAGESALAKHGIYGEAGLSILRQAMTYGENGPASAEELKAFDQVAAEFLGQPFGTAGRSLAVSRVTQATTLLKLGGVVFNQLAESANLATAVGVTKTLQSVASFKRLRAEIKLIAEGKDPDGSLLRKMEKIAGVDYGMDGYRVSAFLDNHGLEREVYGQETPGVLDRLLRGGVQAQMKITLWRTVQAVQQRGAAEAITRHILELVSGGKGRKGDADMGIDPSLIQRLQQYPNAIKRGPDLRIEDFDPTGMPPELVMDLVSTIQRGVSQVIQETHIGERSAWHHSDMARVLTQFRSYPITAIEKQWNRQRNIGGTSRAMGILLGSIAVAAPVYMARVVVASAFRDDREEYLEKHLDPLAIARASLNYTSASGLAGDFIEALTDTLATDKDRRDRTLLGRMAPANPNRSVVGNILGPSADVITDAYGAVKAVGQIRDAASAHDALMAATKIMPGSRAPFLLPLINALDSADPAED